MTASVTVVPFSSWQFTSDKVVCNIDGKVVFDKTFVNVVHSSMNAVTFMFEVDHKDDVDLIGEIFIGAETSRIPGKGEFDIGFDKSLLILPFPTVSEQGRSGHQRLPLFGMVALSAVLLLRISSRTTMTMMKMSRIRTQRTTMSPITFSAPLPMTSWPSMRGIVSRLLTSRSN